MTSVGPVPPLGKVLDPSRCVGEVGPAGGRDAQQEGRDRGGRPRHAVRSHARDVEDQVDVDWSDPGPAPAGLLRSIRPCHALLARHCSAPPGQVLQSRAAQPLPLPSEVVGGVDVGEQGGLIRRQRPFADSHSVDEGPDRAAARIAEAVERGGQGRRAPGGAQQLTPSLRVDRDDGLGIAGTGQLVHESQDDGCGPRSVHGDDGQVVAC